jgi:hypothetical protein
MAWSGSFFVLSLILHIVIIGGAGVIVVQVVQGRKEKLKFTAPPPSAAGPSEHKVKPSKKTAAAAPAISKRITSSAANASIALPAMDMSSSTGPDVMASVMSGMGASGLGAGAAGMASMPLSGLTAFGFKGSGNVGLTGKFYDLKQSPSRKGIPMNIGTEVNVLKEFFAHGWDAYKWNREYFSPSNSIKAVQFYIPSMLSVKAPEAFGVEKEVEPSNWVIHYKGNVTASKTTRFRFRGRGDNIMAVRFDNKNVFFNVIKDPYVHQLWDPLFPDQEPLGGSREDPTYGAWISVMANKTYPMEVILSDYGGVCSFFLCIEEENPESSYRSIGSPPKRVYPLFQLKKGLPLPEHKESYAFGESGDAIPVDTNQSIFYAR